MKYYESMANIGCFSRSELAEALHLGDATVATYSNIRKKATSSGCGMTCMS